MIITGFIGFNHAPTKIITSNAQRMIPYSFQKQINMLSKSNVVLVQENALNTSRGTYIPLNRIFKIDLESNLLVYIAELSMSKIQIQQLKLLQSGNSNLNKWVKLILSSIHWFIG